VYVPATGKGLIYCPRILAAVDIGFSSRQHKIDERRQSLFATEIEEGPVPLDWDRAETLELAADDLMDTAVAGAQFTECPSAAAVDKNYGEWEKSLKQWLRKSQCICLYASKRFRMTSEAKETEAAFRIRLQVAASEQRDAAVEKLRKRYGSKATTLENRLLRAEQSIEREQEQSSKKKLDTAISFGTAVLGALLGRKRLTSTTAGRVGTAIRTAGGARKEASDVARAKETADKVRSDLEALNSALQEEIDALDTAFDAQTERLDEVLVKPKSTDIHVELVALAWLPYRKGSDGRLAPAWTG
jgi:hypothetical protein